MAVQTLIKFRRGTDTDWSNANPTLSVGEPGYDTTAEKFKIGDGTTSWSSLGYIGDGNSGIDGSGTAGKLPKFSDSDTLTDSVISESSGGEIGIGSITPASKGTGATGLLDVDGPILARGGVSSNQTDAGVLDYASNILRVRAYGNTSGSGEIQWRVGGGGGSADALGMYLNSSKDLTHYGSTALIADGSSYELSISGSAATLGGNRLQLLSTETVVNNAGSSIDFRVEGDTNQNLLFVDASADKVGIGTDSPAGILHVKGEYSDGGHITIEDTSSALKTRFYNGNTASVIAVDEGNAVGTSSLQISVDNSTKATFGASATTFDQNVTINASTNQAIIGNSVTVFNEGGANVDFRVEGDTDANLLFADASTDRVGIGTSSPSKKLHVVGDLLIDDGSAIVLDANGLKITDDTIGATLDSNCDDAIVIGEGARNYADKSINIANGRFSSDGDCQKITQVLRGSTTNANIFYLSNDGSTAALLNSSGLFLGGTQYNSDHVLLPDNAVFTFTIHVSCRKQSSDDSAAFIIKGAVRNSLGWTDGDTMLNESDASSTRNYHLIDSPIIESFIDSGLAGVTATVTTSYLNPQTSNTVDNLWFGVEVKGLAGTNLRWSAMVDGILTTY